MSSVVTASYIHTQVPFASERGKIYTYLFLENPEIDIRYYS